MEKLIFLVLIFILSLHVIQAQHFCNSNVNPRKAMMLERTLSKTQNRDYSGETPTVRLALHRVNDSNGNGGNSWVDIRNAVDGISQFFAPHDICFTVVNEDDIDDDDFFSLTSFANNNAVWVDLLDENRVGNAINIYFVPEANSGGKATGFLFDAVTDFPTATVSNTTNTDVGSANTFNSEVLAHEIGHCLGLYHTHETLFCEELVVRGQGQNCDTCGDLLCDTPADPNLDVSTNNVNDATCQYLGNDVDDDEQAYVPDTRNVMSYTLPFCMEWFSQGQGDRMRNFILNSTEMDDYVIPADLELVGQQTGTAYYGAETSIVSSAQHSFGDISYEASESIVLTPGFSVSAADATFVASIGELSCDNPLIENSGRMAMPSSQIMDDGLSLELFPNPTESTTTLRTSVPQGAKMKVVVTDLSGREHLLFEGASPSGSQMELDLSNFNPGVYFIIVTTHSEWETVKLILE